MSWCDPGVRLFSTAILETYLSYHKDIRIAATDHYMYIYFYLSLQSPLTAVLQLIQMYFKFKY